MHRSFAHFISAVVVIAFVCVPGPAAAQDPTRSLPQSYKVQFENAYVRVVRVHYDAGAKLPTHTHGAGTTAYIYLNDSDGIVFRHTGNRTHVVNRQAVKAGGMRVSVGQEEAHEVENRSKTPADFLRLSITTDPGGAAGMRRIAPADASFTSPQIRVTRLSIEQHDAATIDAKQPALIVELPSGSTRWVDAGSSATIENHEVPQLALVRIDFLTKPQ